MRANPYLCRYIGRPDIGRYERAEPRPEPLFTPWTHATAEQIIADILRFKRYGDEYYGVTTVGIRGDA